MNALPAPQAFLTERTLVPLSAIDVPAGRRQLDPAWVETLSGMIAEQGLIVPIELVAVGGRFRLVMGGHRLAAVSRLGWDAIPSFVKSLEQFAGESAVKLREIAENMIRRPLSALDKAFDVAEWRNIYEATHAVAKPGRKRKPASPEEAEEISRMFATHFSAAASKALGIDRATVFRHLKIASIGQELRGRISLLAIADNQSELLQLAREPEDRRVAIADILVSQADQAGGIADAIRILDKLPEEPAPMRWEKLSAGFSRLRSHEQDAFFRLHEEAVLRWARERLGERGKP